MNQQNPFKWRHFEAEIILLCLRWYPRYTLSYRDLEEMMRERCQRLHTFGSPNLLVKRWEFS